MNSYVRLVIYAIVVAIGWRAFIRITSHERHGAVDSGLKGQSQAAHKSQHDARKDMKYGETIMEKSNQLKMTEHIGQSRSSSHEKGKADDVKPHSTHTKHTDSRAAHNHDASAQGNENKDAERKHSQNTDRAKPKVIDGTPLKTILLWDALFVDRSHSFLTHKCGPCHISRDRAQLELADAVVFHAFQMDPSDIPTRAFPEQIYVFYMYEAPLEAEYKIRGMNDIFNLTFTYLDDPMTDIHEPLGRVVKRHDTDGPYTAPDTSALAGKDRQVAWLVHDCQPHSMREAYVNELSKHIHVDTYGKCGKQKCRKNDPNGCYTKLEKHYKFILAFEHSYCKDFISESIFQPMQYNIVPVVLGLANYKSIFPEKSFIDVRDFGSPKELAAFLHGLGDDMPAYQKYFQWRNNHRTETMMERPRGFCTLCDIMHNADYKYKKDFNVEEYWQPDTLCETGRQERESIHFMD